jgi:hypothetical protein
VVSCTLPWYLSRGISSDVYLWRSGLLAEEVTRRGEVFGGQRLGRGMYFPLLLILILPNIIISRGHRLQGCFLPPLPHGRLGGTPKQPPLFLCLPPFIVGTVGILPCCIFGQGDPPTGHYAHMQDPTQECLCVKKAEIDTI